MLTPREIYLALNDIGHRRTKAGKSQIIGLVERFDETVPDEFTRGASRSKFYAFAQERQADHDA